MSAFCDGFARFDPRFLVTSGVLLALLLGLFVPRVCDALCDLWWDFKEDWKHHIGVLMFGLLLLLAAQLFPGEAQHFFSGQLHGWFWVGTTSVALLATIGLHHVVTGGERWQWSWHLPATVLLLLLAGASGVVADLIHALLVEPAAPDSPTDVLIGATIWPWLATGSMFLAFLLAFPLLQMVTDRSEYLQWRPLDRKDQCRCLVMGLSPMGPDNAVSLDERLPAALRPALTAARSHPDLECFFGAYDNDLRLSDDEKRACLWIMNLSALKFHCNELKTVLFVCTDRAVRQVHHAAELLRIFKHDLACKVLARDKGDDCRFINLNEEPVPDNDCASASWTIQNYPDLRKALEKAVRKLQREPKYDYRERQIMIDVTSGPRPLAVVSAMLTYNRCVRIQYVNTDNIKEVSVYDLKSSAEIPR